MRLMNNKKAALLKCSCILHSINPLLNIKQLHFLSCIFVLFFQVL